MIELARLLVYIAAIIMGYELELCLTVGVLFLAALTRSTFGFGDALLAMPLLAMMMDPGTAAPLVALAATTIGVTILVQSWREVRLRSALGLIIPTLLGIPIGLYFVREVDERTVKLALAGFVLLVAANGLLRPSFFQLKTDRAAPLFGFVSGVLGGAYNTNGPVAVFYGMLRGWSPESFRATLQAYFVSTGLFIIIGHLVAGNLTPSVLTSYGLSAPAVIIGVLIGARLNKRFKADQFAKAVYGLLIVVAALLVSSVLTTG